MIDKETAENLLGESKTELVDMLCNMSLVIDDYEAKEKAHKAKINELKEWCNKEIADCNSALENPSLKFVKDQYRAHKYAFEDMLKKLEELTNV